MIQPVLVDHENKVVYYNEEDVTDEIIDYWAQTPPYFPVAKYEGEYQKSQIEKINIDRALRRDKDAKIDELILTVNDLKNQVKTLTDNPK